MLITFPVVYGIYYSIKGNPVRQIVVDGSQREGALVPFTRGRLKGFVFQPGVVDQEVLIVPPEAKRLPDGQERILRASVNADVQALDLSKGSWLRHPLRHVEEGQVDHERKIAECLESWIGAFSYVQEDPPRQIVGLRNPQLGALHAIHAHWSVTDATATIVMPTGTGKTEVMLSILVSCRCPKLLVVAPTDALRAQLAGKFATLGVLKAAGSSLLNAKAQHPVVCILHHIPNSPDEVDYIFARSHVIVTTSMVAGQSERSVQDRMAHHCPYFFIDEAHHAEYDMIINDDGKGETADVVAIRIQGELTAPTAIEVEFYHCKYSGDAAPGQRVDDLYEVCGQAQKSIRWMCSSEKRSDLFTHLLRREANREERGLASRYEVGDTEMLQTIREMSHFCLVKLTIHIVQPGLSKANATLDQLELLSVTENHLMEIYGLPFVVISSP